MKNFLLAISLGISIILTSCAPSTVVTGSWKSPKADAMRGTHKHVFVAAMVSDVSIKTKLEDAISIRAKERGMEVTESADVFPPGFTKSQIPDKEKLVEIIRKTGSDLIITVAVKSIKEETRYVQGSSSPMYAPYPRYGYYGGFYGYYGQTYQEGYYTTDEIVFLETNIYDVATEDLIWSGQTKTTNAGSIDTFLKEYLYATLDRLEKDKMIKPSAKK